MSTEAIAIIGAVATVIAGFGGAALGACFAYRTGIKLVQKTNANAIHLANENRFREASERFLIAFQEAMSELEFDGGKKVYDIITPKLIQHKNAFMIFRRYLDIKTRNKFDSVWKDYFPAAHAMGNAPEHQYQKWEEETERKLMLAKIERIIEFGDFNHIEPLNVT